MASIPIYMLSIALCLSAGFQQGYVASVLNQPYLAIESFINQSWIERTGTPINANTLNIMWATLNICFPLATIVGQFLAAYLCQRIGRKKTALVATGLYVPGALISYLARDMSPYFEALFVGRFVWSVAIGINTVNATVWIVECAPVKHRGRMAAMQEVFMATGSLLTQALGVPFSSESLWHYMFIPPLVISSISFVIFCLLKDSPQSLLKEKNGMLKARKSLASYHGTDENDPSLESELLLCQTKGDRKPSEPSANKEQINCNHDGITVMFKPWTANDPVSKVIRHAAWLGVMVKIAYVFTGARCLRAYSTFVLHSMSGWSLDHALFGSFLIGLLRLPITMIPVLFVDKVGRRPLIIGSAAVSLVSLLVVLISIENAPEWKMGSLVGLAVLLLINACGIGSVSRFYAAELVPRNLLLKSVSILAIFEAIIKIAVEFSFYPLANLKALQVGASSLMMFLVPTGLFIIFMCNYCPETSGRSVNEVLDSVARRKNIKVSFSSTVIV
uniref:MFS domain-containing protein n=1 Tax=Steinernema glaseri TaxID=37863 RepID=A0A1I7Z7I2_9BILA